MMIKNKHAQVQYGAEMDFISTIRSENEICCIDSQRDLKFITHIENKSY